MLGEIPRGHTKRISRHHKNLTDSTTSELWQRHLYHRPRKSWKNVLSRNGIRTSWHPSIWWSLHRWRWLMWRCLTPLPRRKHLTGQWLTPLPRREQRKLHSHRVGQEEEGLSSNRPELVTLRECCLESHQDHENLLYLTDSETSLQVINKWIGGGAKLNLTRSPDGDVLKGIIIKLQRRVKAWVSNPTDQG